MSPRRTLLLALLVALAGCTGVGVPSGDSTTAETTADTTTEPHTAQGTSHIGSHLSVRAAHDVENVTVTLAPGGDASTFEVEPGPEHSLTREIHERGHDVRGVAARGDETVFDREIQGYQSFELTVYENDTRRTQSVV
jgi:hypothetical protein